MRYSSLFLKTTSNAKTLDSVNATLLQKGGFIDQVASGIYTMLPLGLRVMHNIENIVRHEMNTLGSELLMPSLSPTSLWEQTGRGNIDVLLHAKGANDASLKRNDSTYILNPTHEEIVTPLAQKIKTSYKDFPFAVYQIQTKFRNEERAKSGLMRGREFRMKDLYSFHTSEEDLQQYYEQVKRAYMNICTAMGLGEDTKITKASGGDFTSGYSHEFQTLCDAGEDTIYIDTVTGEAWNSEVAPPEGSFTKHQASEIGNIFPLNTKFSDAFGYTYTDADGSRKPVYMGSYGIGITRLMGVLVEKFHDEKGIIWPLNVAPYTVYLAGLSREDATTVAAADAAYEALQKSGIAVLYDDRDIGTGAKFADADLLGVPWRVVVSKKTAGKMEVTSRTTSEMHLYSVSEFLNAIGQ